MINPSIFRFDTIMVLFVIKFKIFSFIVGLIPIKMMNMFRLLQWSIKKFFHNISMLIKVFPINSNSNIAIFHQVSSTFPSIMRYSSFCKTSASSRTKMGGTYSVRINPEFSRAVFTYFYYGWLFNVRHNLTLSFWHRMSSKKEVMLYEAD